MQKLCVEIWLQVLPREKKPAYTIQVKKARQHARSNVHTISHPDHYHAERRCMHREFTHPSPFAPTRYAISETIVVLALESTDSLGRYNFNQVR